MSANPQQFLTRLATLAQESRHHPQPGVAVAMLCQLLLDVVAELQPLADRYGLLLRTGGAGAVLAELDKHIEGAKLQLVATSLPAAGITTGEGSTDQAGHNPDLDTTGTAG